MSHEYLRFLSLLCARTAIVLFFLLLGLRLLGKRQVGQMNVYDLAMIMAVANAVQNAMTSGAGDLSAGVVCSGTLLLIGYLLSRLFVHMPKLEDRIVGTPTVLIQSGELLRNRLRKENITEAEITSVLHQHGLMDSTQVMTAVLEVDGTISIIPRGEPHHKTRIQP